MEQPANLEREQPAVVALDWDTAGCAGCPAGLSVVQRERNGPTAWLLLGGHADSLRALHPFVNANRIYRASNAGATDSRNRPVHWDRRVPLSDETPESLAVSSAN